MRAEILRHRGRRGYSLVELLVVVSIIFLLAGLLMPAVQSAREATRRAQCQSNLRQFGLALNNYATQHGSFPYLSVGFSSEQYGSYSPHSSLLPFMDLVVLWNSANFSSDSDPAFELVPSPSNMTVAQTKIAFFVCPSDPGSSMTEFGPTTYRANQGTATGSGEGIGPPREGINGAFEPMSSVRPEQVTDGLSFTSAFSEKPIGGRPTPFEPFVGYWVNGSALYTNIDGLIAACQSLVGEPTVYINQVGGVWFKPTLANTSFNHNAGPNSVVSDCIGGWNSPTPHWHGSFAARSYHPLVVNVVFIDGHVKLVKDRIDMNTWRALGTRNGSEVLSEY